MSGSRCYTDSPGNNNKPPPSLIDDDGDDDESAPPRGDDDDEHFHHHHHRRSDRPLRGGDNDDNDDDFGNEFAVGTRNRHHRSSSKTKRQQPRSGGVHTSSLADLIVQQSVPDHVRRHQVNDDEDDDDAFPNNNTKRRRKRASSSKHSHPHETRPEDLPDDAIIGTENRFASENMKWLCGGAVVFGPNTSRVFISSASIVVPFILFAVFILPFTHIALIVAVCVGFIVTQLLLWRTATKDPGIVPRRTEDNVDAPYTQTVRLLRRPQKEEENERQQQQHDTNHDLTDISSSNNDDSTPPPPPLHPRDAWRQAEEEGEGIDIHAPNRHCERTNNNNATTPNRHCERTNNNNATTANGFDVAELVRDAPQGDEGNGDADAVLCGDDGRGGFWMQIKYCYTCQRYRGPRTHHCSACDCCIDVHDHHCPWIGTCIGVGNFPFFLWFLLSVQLYFLIALVALLEAPVMLSIRAQIPVMEAMGRMYYVNLVLFAYLFLLMFGPTGLIDIAQVFFEMWCV